MAKCMLNNQARPLYLREYLIIKPAIVINAGWVTVASFLGVGVCFKKFEVHFNHESIWAIVGVVVLFCVFTANSWRYGGFLLGSVFVFVNFTLFYKYNTEEAKGKNYFLV